MRLILVLLAVSAAARAEETVDKGKVVAARLERCSSCQMARFNKCKEWIETEAQRYPAVEVTHMHGRAPVIYWFDIFGDTLGTTRVKETDTVEDVGAYFHDKGIMPGMPEPKWMEKPASSFAVTDNCIAFRRHNVYKERLPRSDEPCHFKIPPGGGIGYCECTNGKRPEIQIGKKREYVTCEEVCVLGKAPWDEEEL
ncbi:hypothetical protein DIPPA_28871 [Diplonema papillatum]|nr:hypothetical protein DIPPA_15640 [Diplonema papillatum]KAJ9457111.1 hypothetical protein DIPPA_28871 [Diplonema papillatum]